MACPACPPVQMCPEQHCAADAGLPQEVCHPWLPVLRLPHRWAVRECQRPQRRAGVCSPTTGRTVFSSSFLVCLFHACVIYSFYVYIFSFLHSCSLYSAICACVALFRLLTTFPSLPNSVRTCGLCPYAQWMDKGRLGRSLSVHSRHPVSSWLLCAAWRQHLWPFEFVYKLLHVSKAPLASMPSSGASIRNI